MHVLLYCIQHKYFGFLNNLLNVMNEDVLINYIPVFTWQRKRTKKINKTVTLTFLLRWKNEWEFCPNVSTEWDDNIVSSFTWNVIGDILPNLGTPYDVITSTKEYKNVLRKLPPQKKNLNLKGGRGKFLNITKSNARLYEVWVYHLFYYFTSGSVQ